MSGYWDAAFSNAWFGPFKVANVFPHRKPEKKHPGPVYNDGPMDGLLEASIHAQSFAQIPLMNHAQRMSPIGRQLGTPNFCRPGYTPVPTGVPGQSKCVFYSAPSQMVGAPPFNTVSATLPPTFPTSRTFPVGPRWGWKQD